MYFFGVNFPIGTYCPGANIYAFCMSNTTLMIPRIFRNFAKELRYILMMIQELYGVPLGRKRCTQKNLPRFESFETCSCCHFFVH